MDAWAYLLARRLNVSLPFRTQTLTFTWIKGLSLKSLWTIVTLQYLDDLSVIKFWYSVTWVKSSFACSLAQLSSEKYLSLLHFEKLKLYIPKKELLKLTGEANAQCVRTCTRTRSRSFVNIFHKVNGKTNRETKLEKSVIFAPKHTQCFGFWVEKYIETFVNICGTSSNTNL